MAKGYTQKNLADEIGVSQPYISELLTGKKFRLEFAAGYRLTKLLSDKDYKRLVIKALNVKCQQKKMSSK